MHPNATPIATMQPAALVYLWLLTCAVGWATTTTITTTTEATTAEATTYEIPDYFRQICFNTQTDKQNCKNNNKDAATDACQTWSIIYFSSSLNGLQAPGSSSSPCFNDDYEEYLKHASSYINVPNTPQTLQMFIKPHICVTALGINLIHSCPNGVLIQKDCDTEEPTANPDNLQCVLVSDSKSGTSSETTKDRTTDWIIGGTVGGVGFVIAVVVIVVLVRRHRHLKWLQQSESTGLLMPKKKKEPLLLQPKSDEGAQAAVTAIWNNWSVY